MRNWSVVHQVNLRGRSQSLFKILRPAIFFANAIVVMLILLISSYSPTACYSHHSVAASQPVAKSARYSAHKLIYIWIYGTSHTRTSLIMMNASGDAHCLQLPPISENTKPEILLYLPPFQCDFNGEKLPLIVDL